MSAPEPAILYPCPVRTRYGFQRAAYGPAIDAWCEVLALGAQGKDAGATERLLSLAQRAEEGTLYYPRSFAATGVHWSDLRSAADLPHLPSLPRLELQAHHLELFHHEATADVIEEGWMGQSSGSTGAPVRFFMDAVSIHFFLSFIRFLWDRHGMGPLPAPGSTGIVLLCTLPRSSVYETWLPLFGTTLFRKLHFEEEGAHASLNALMPAVITGDPDSLSRLRDALASGEVEVRPRLILSSAFALPPELGRELRSLTGAVVIDYYSMAEMGPLAWRCEAGTLHALEGAVELEDDAGELLVTNLRNRYFPLLRYRTGDLAQVAAPSTCVCGATTRTLSRFEGRVTSRFLAGDGRKVDPSQLQPLLAKLPLRQFQLVQREKDRVCLRYFAEAEIPLAELATLGEALRRLLRGPATLESEWVRAPLFRPGEKPLPYHCSLRDPGRA